jgi:FkbM family methyltransferase
LQSTFLYFHRPETDDNITLPMSIRQLIKWFVVFFKLPLTQNLAYDIATKKILKQVLKADSNCIDIGCHKGEIMDDILNYAPLGKHFAFEPLPHLVSFLKEKYKNQNITISDIALFDKKGDTTFNYVVNAPAYSGIRKRHYDIPDAQISELNVETDLLDNLIPEAICIDFIKIDVEGAEFPVLKGGVKMIRRCKPVIIFEFGMGAADYYGAKPENLYAFLTIECELSISTLKGFISNAPCLSETEFCDNYKEKKEYYFVAYSPPAIHE